MYHALDIARYIIQYYRKKGILISNLKLQKLLYYVQGECLVDPDITSPCFEEPIEAWKHGPVVRDVYDNYSIYMGEKIPSNQPPKEEINSFYRKAIDRVLDRYQDTEPWELVHKTHHESPWLDTYQEDQNCIISLESIRDYFSLKGK